MTVREPDRARTRGAIFAAAAALAVVLWPAAGIAQPIPGTRDAGFGTEGVIRTRVPLGFFDYLASALDVAIDGAGRIVAVGYGSATQTHPGHLVVLRYLHDGQLDTTFGGTGVVTTPVGIGSSRATAVAIQPDGRIVVAGGAVHPPQAGLDPLLVRFRVDGSPDPTFGSAGVVLTPFDERVEIRGMTLQPDGKILLAGDVESPSTAADPLVMRHHPNGLLDDSFGVGGIVRLSLNGVQRVTDVALTSTGRILLSAGGEGGALLARLRPTGELDDTFSGGGVVFTPNAPAGGLVLQPDRKVVVPGGRNGTAMVARHHSTGSLDAAFGEDGIATYTYHTSQGYDAVVQQNGRIVVAGSYESGGIGTDEVDPFLWRVEPDGTRDLSFVYDRPPRASARSLFNAVALQPDGKLVAVGESAYPYEGILVARFHGDRTDLIFADGFESGGTTAWSSTASDGGDLQVTVGAAADATSFGLLGTVDDTAPLYVQDDTPHDEPRYRARFHLHPRDFDPGEALGHRRTRTFIVFSEGPQRRVAAIVLRRQGGAYAVMGRARLDDNAQADSPWVALDSAPHTIELDLKASSGPEANDGWLHLWVDGAQVATLDGLDNSLGLVDFVRLGALSLKGGAAGTLSWDTFESRRETAIGH